MNCITRLVFAIIPIILLYSCKEEVKPQSKEQPEVRKDTVIPEREPDSVKQEVDSVAPPEEAFKLTTENAIPFFFEYQKKHKENKVLVKTSMGDFVIRLYDETPYHRANFIFLADKKYFDNTLFHRVVKGFIIQGGNSDRAETSQKRNEIGRYLLPPDTRKGFKHHRGVVSMPSGEDVSDPFKMASPFEFFIVVTKPGSYHLDGGYTAFGEVISGMDVVDKINALETDRREWPLQNAVIREIRVIR